jgi:hypothetical protein
MIQRRFTVTFLVPLVIISAWVCGGRGRSNEEEGMNKCDLCDVIIRSYES